MEKGVIRAVMYGFLSLALKKGIVSTKGSSNQRDREKPGRTS